MGDHKAQEFIDEGLLWKARDRLHGMHNASPHDQEVLNQLGEVYFEMGDLPQAGRYWLLTDRDDESSRRAKAEFEARYKNGGPREQLRVLTPRAKFSDYPPVVEKRLDGLLAAANADGGPNLEIRERVERVDDDEPWWTGIVVFGFIAAFVGVWVIGAAAIVWIFAKAVF